MCPLCATSRITSGFHAYPITSHSGRPVKRSHRHTKKMVIMSRMVRTRLHHPGRFPHRHHQPKEQLRRRRVWRAVVTAGHAHGIGRVRVGERRIGGHDLVRVVAKPLGPSVPDVAHHVAVVVDRPDHQRQAARDGAGHGEFHPAPIRVAACEPHRRGELADPEQRRDREEERTAEPRLRQRERERGADQSQAGEEQGARRKLQRTAIMCVCQTSPKVRVRLPPFRLSAKATVDPP